MILHLKVSLRNDVSHILNVTSFHDFNVAVLNLNLLSVEQFSAKRAFVNLVKSFFNIHLMLSFSQIFRFLGVDQSNFSTRKSV